jgi:hypothetical protein
LDTLKGPKAMDDELLAWAMKPEIRVGLVALRAVYDALEREHRANDDDSRRLAHEHALAAAAAFDVATGLVDFYRRRVLSTAAGQPAHRPLSTSTELKTIFRRGSKGSLGETEQRYAISRILLDTLGALLGGAPENREVTRLVLADMGYSLPGEGKLKDAPEGIRAVTLQQGVNPAGGPAAKLKLGLFNVLGYTLGAEGKRDSPPAEWGGAPPFIFVLSRKGVAPRSTWTKSRASWHTPGPTSRTRRRTAALRRSPACATTFRSAPSFATRGARVFPTGATGLSTRH